MCRRVTGGAATELAFLGGSILAIVDGALPAGALAAPGPQTTIAEFYPVAVDGAQRRSALITPRLDRRSDVYAVAYGGATW